MQVKYFMQKIFSGIAFMHESSIIHRGLKRSNVLYMNEGDIKLCGFDSLRRSRGGPYDVGINWSAPELLLGLTGEPKIIFFGAELLIEIASTKEMCR